MTGTNAVSLGLTSGQVSRLPPPVRRPPGAFPGGSIGLINCICPVFTTFLKLGFVGLGLVVGFVIGFVGAGFACNSAV